MAKTLVVKQQTYMEGAMRVFVPLSLLFFFASGSCFAVDCPFISGQWYCKNCANNAGNAGWILQADDCTFKIRNEVGNQTIGRFTGKRTIHVDAGGGWAALDAVLWPGDEKLEWENRSIWVRKP